MAGKDITADRLRDVLDYDLVTGFFTWRKDGRNVQAGGRAGAIEKGYRRIKIDKRFYYAHRLAWLFVRGHWPCDLVDHINGIRDDNQWVNLRECSTAQNAQNTLSSSANRSGLKGVGWDSNAGKWRAAIMLAGKTIYLGLYASKEDAHSVYLEAKAKLHTFQPVPRNA